MLDAVVDGEAVNQYRRHRPWTPLGRGEPDNAAAVAEPQCAVSIPYRRVDLADRHSVRFSVSKDLSIGSIDPINPARRAGIDAADGILHHRTDIVAGQAFDDRQARDGGAIGHR